MRIKFNEEIDLLKKNTQNEIKLEMNDSTSERESVVGSLTKVSGGQKNIRRIGLSKQRK